MATQPIHKTPENRQPFADQLTDIENREQPDWDEVWRGYERYCDEQERGTVQ